MSSNCNFPFWVRYNLHKDGSPIADGFDKKDDAEEHIKDLTAKGYKPQRKYNITNSAQLNLG